VNRHDQLLPYFYTTVTGPTAMQLFGSKSKCKKISRPFRIVLDIMPFIVAKIPVEEGSNFQGISPTSPGCRQVSAPRALDDH
jgi:hypothetical protein